jgi:NDP-sugar pyrophosphorylase family protein
MNSSEDTVGKRNYVGAILAAGRGTRMQPFSESIPKPLLPVCNRPIIVHQIEAMRSVGIEEITILIGHRGYEIAKALGDGSGFGVRLKYIEQREILGIAHAVGLLEPAIDRPFLLFLGDIYFVPRSLALFFDTFEAQGGGAVLGTKDEPDPAAIRRNFSLVLREDGSVSRVVEKPRHAPNRLKGVGLYFFDPAVFDSIRRTPRTALRDEYELTDSIQVMIEDGYPVRPANVVSEDINITNPADLLMVNLLHASRFEPHRAVSPVARLHSGAVVENSVIGANVEVLAPVTIANSLILDNTVVESRNRIEGAILTPGGAYDCRPDLDWTAFAARPAAFAANV